MSGIRLHKQFGLNPTLLTCFYCGEETGEIALLGANYKGEAPMHMCNSIEPCSKCKEKYQGKYQLVVEMNKDKNQPTGRWVGIDINCVVNPELKDRLVFLATEDTFNELFVNKKED